MKFHLLAVPGGSLATTLVEAQNQAEELYCIGREWICTKKMHRWTVFALTVPTSLLPTRIFSSNFPRAFYMEFFAGPIQYFEQHEAYLDSCPRLTQINKHNIIDWQMDAKCLVSLLCKKYSTTVNSLHLEFTCCYCQGFPCCSWCAGPPCWLFPPLRETSWASSAPIVLINASLVACDFWTVVRLNFPPALEWSKCQRRMSCMVSPQLYLIGVLLKNLIKLIGLNDITRVGQLLFQFLL